MKTFAYDLHIHSCLSPCGDNDMTPANIVGMAVVKGLDVIAVTDHNSCRNCPAAIKAGELYGVRVIPGMELCTAEEVHVLCLFPDLYAAMDFDHLVYSKMLKIPNNETIFGEQILYDTNDTIMGKEPSLLICNTSICFDDVYTLTHERNGIMIPAHIDKTANSLLSNLGFVPPDSRFTCAEVHDLSKLAEISQKNPYLKTCQILCNSDAHYLEHIHEPEYFLKARSKEICDIFQVLRTPNK